MPSPDQRCTQIVDGRIETWVFPPHDTDILPGVPWGRFDEILTSAFWAMRLRQEGGGASRAALNRIGATLAEEIAACLLGGFGMPAEVGLAAFARLRDRGCLCGTPDAATLERHLAEPLQVDGRTVRYRFPRQKATYLSAALAHLATEPAPMGDVALRDWLLRVRGIGPKTASWITRNWRLSDAVAIIDIHILRAGRTAGVFPAAWTPERAYAALETRFLAWCQALGTRPAVFDHLLWHDMRQLWPALRGLSASRRSDLGSDADA